MSWNERLRKLVHEQQLSMAELARVSGVPYDSVNKYLRGDVENPRGNTLKKLAKALGTDEVFLRTGLVDRKPLASEPIPFRGEVAAGVWIEVGDAITEPEDWLPFNPAPHYPTGSVYCLTVRGDSIDKIAPPGTILVCVDVLSAGINIRDNDLVIVERSKEQNGLIEMTAKRVRQVDGGFVLVPESTNPKWKPVSFPYAIDDEGESIRVIARVEYVLKKP